MLTTRRLPVLCTLLCVLIAGCASNVKPDSANIRTDGTPKYLSPPGYWRLRFADEREMLVGKPVFCDGKVVLTCVRDENWNTTHALDEYTGEEKWIYPAAGRLIASDGNAVIVPGFDDTVHCVDGLTGRALGKSKMETNMEFYRNGKAYGRANGRIYCCDAKTGETLWKYKVYDEAIMPPAFCGDMVIFGDIAGAVHAIDVNTGKRKWKAGSVILFTSTLGFLTSGPASDGDTVCVPISVGPYEVKVYALDAQNGRVKWISEERCTYDTPLVYDNKVYFAGRGHVFCLDADSGKKIWDYTADDIRGIEGNGIMASDGVIYVKAYMRKTTDVTIEDYHRFLEMQIHAIDARTGRLLSRTPSFPAGDSSYSTVALHDHALFVVSCGTAEIMGNLYCFEDYRFNPSVIQIACTYQEYKAKPPVPEDADALAFVEQEKWNEKPEYFLLILESARDQFVEPSIRALERITGEKFTGDLSDIKTAREQAYQQYRDYVAKSGAK